MSVPSIKGAKGTDLNDWNHGIEYVTGLNTGTIFSYFNYKSMVLSIEIGIESRL